MSKAKTTAVENASSTVFNQLVGGLVFDKQKNEHEMKRFKAGLAQQQQGNQSIVGGGDQALASATAGANVPTCESLGLPPPSSSALNFFGAVTGKKKGGNDSDDGEDKLPEEPKRAEPPVKKMTREKRVNLRAKLDLDVKGGDIPQPMIHFSELVRPPNNVPRYLATNLFERNHRIPTPIQAQGIPIMLQGRDLLACAPTGSGKTVSFLVPMFHQLKQPQGHDVDGVRAVIVSPTKELAQQIEREAFFLMKGMRWRFVQHGKSTVGKDIFITTPNRIVSLLEAKALDLSKVEFLTFDEGDKLWDKESDFLGLMDKVLAACSKPDKTIGFFSATLPQRIEALARTVMKDPVRIIVKGRVTSNANVDQKLVYTGDEIGKIEEMKNMVREGITLPALLFVQSIERTKDLYDEIKAAGLHVGLINSKMTAEQRDEVVLQFRLGKIWILITSELLARGIDFKGVGTVINFDMPTNAESYVHRVGRTGRAGKRGVAITFYTDDDKERLPIIAKIISDAGGEVDDWMKDLKVPSTKRQRELAIRTPQRMIVSTKKRIMVGQKRTERQLAARTRGGDDSDSGDDDEEDF